MPNPDPDHGAAHGDLSRQWLLRAVRAASLGSIIMACLAVALVARGDPAPKIERLIMVALLIGIAALAALAVLPLRLFISSRGAGRAAPHHHKDVS